MESLQKEQTDLIRLSNLTQVLIKNLAILKKKPRADETSRISVSQTVSFFALLYEKIRNAIEYREEHLIRRAAIERIVKRRLTLNPEGVDEAENIVRELLWARYFPNESLSTIDVSNVQNIIDKYLHLKKMFLIGRPEKVRVYFSQFLMDLLTCEIEETLSPDLALKNSIFTFFFYQVLRKKIRIEEINKEFQDAYFYVSVEKGFAKNDLPYLRFHLFKLFFKPIGSYSKDELKKLNTSIPQIFKKIDLIINNPYIDKLVRFVKKQSPPFLILFELLSRYVKNAGKLLADKTQLFHQVDIICREKYQQVSTRLKTTAIKSLIYIFLTKMILALLLEYPLSIYLYHEINYASIVINSLFPPILMLFIVGLVSVPGEKNTQKLYQRLVEIIDEDASFENRISWVSKKPKVKRPILLFGFTVLYSLTFIITLSLIYKTLTFLNFNLISQAIFLFFVSLVAFFGFRVRQITNEYHLEDKGSFFSPFVDFFFMPILSLGKFLSSEIAKFNFFIIIFDFLIEAPFKLIFEIVEEWISFVRARKEEIM